MNASAFFKLFWRPGTLVLLFFALPPWLGLYVAFTKIDFAYFPDPANSLLVIVPFVGAGLVGSALLEVYASPFSWTLPDLRRRFSAIALIAGLVASAIALGAHQWTGGALAAAPAFALAACCYALSIYYFYRVAKGHGMPVLAAGLLLVDYAAAQGMSHPLTLSALALAGWLFYRICTPEALRAANPDSRNNMFNANAYARIGTDQFGNTADSRSRSRARWPWAYLGASLWRWVRAGEYERNGHSRLGVFALPLIGIGMTFFMPALAVCAHAYRHSLPLSTALGDVWGLFIALDLGIERDFRISVATTWKISSGFLFFFGLADFGAGFNNLGSHDHQYPKFLYPLARRQRARISFWTGLGKGALYALVLTAAYYAAVLAGAAALGREINYVLPVVYPVALTLILLPLPQLLGLRFWPRYMAAPSATPYQVVGAAFAFAAPFGVAALSVYWMEMSPQWPVWPQIAAALAAAALIYALYYRKLQWHYARHDLVK